MKKLYSFLLSLIFTSAFAQCPAENVTLSTQADVNAFAANYPTCSAISGDLWISGAGITDLSPLIPIHTISGSLVIYLCSSLQNLNGLNNVTSIGGSLDINVNPQLTSIGGLENLTSIGNSLIINNVGTLTNLNGLQALTTVNSLMSIKGTGLISLTGLDNLVSIGFFLEISNNPALVSLAALSNLTQIGGYIDMQNNPVLTTLSGFDNISPTSITAILIRNSPNLSFCSVESFCVFLTSIGGGTFTNNATGCNSQPEITAICNLAVNEAQIPEISIYPNPVKDILKLNLGKSMVTSFVIIEPSGKIVMQSTTAKNAIDVSSLKSGMYILSITTTDRTFNMKFLKQ
jgi:type IX secretion system substrate protein